MQVVEGWGVWPLCPAHYSVSPAILTSGNWQVGEGSQCWGGRRKGRRRGVRGREWGRAEPMEGLAEGWKEEG